jgi:hypothetical protein
VCRHLAVDPVRIVDQTGYFTPRLVLDLLFLGGRQVTLVVLKFVAHLDSEEDELTNLFLLHIFLVEV